MLTKFVPVARTLNAVARQQAVRCMGGHAPAHWKTDSEVATEEKSHMNDMPVPQGSWQENYNRRNSKWNIQLGVSFAALLVTLFVRLAIHNARGVIQAKDYCIATLYL